MTDPPLPPSEFEDVRIDNWQTRLPSAICTNKEIFDEIFSLETWKTVLQQDQKDRILKMLPPEIAKLPGAAEKTIEDLLSKELSNFGTNPLDELFDKLDNGHYDPEVVETKADIVREWRRDSLRLKRHYHTKLLQDIVISREDHLRKLLPSSTHNKNGKKNAATANYNNNSSAASKKNGKPGAALPFTTNGTPTVTNGVSRNGSSKNYKNSQQQPHLLKYENSGSPSTVNHSSNKKPPDNNKNKRGRLEAALLSPPSTSSNDVSSSEGPATKRAKQSSTKGKGNSNKKAKEQQQIIVVTTSQPSPSPSSSTSSLLMSSPSPGNGAGTAPKTSLLLGTLTSGIAPNEPPTLSLRSPSSNAAPPPPTSLLESLTSPINPPPPNISFANNIEGTLAKQYSKIFPNSIISSPATAAAPVSTSSYLPSPVQSSPILASQLQAPPPISVNLSSLTGIGGLTSSRNGNNVTGSPSHSSITLNYTQAPLPPSATLTSQQQQQNQIKSLLDEVCSSSATDGFEFETIEPTIGFGGPPMTNSSSIKSTTSIPISSSGQSSLDYNNKKEVIGTISRKELANIQKCSLLTNCLTQPLSSNSSSAAAVSAALANNILTSTPVQMNSTGGIQQILQQQQQPHKIIVTGGGVVATNSMSQQQHQQLQKFLTAATAPTSSASSLSSALISPQTTQKILTQQQLDAMFQQQPNHQPQRNIVSVTATAPQTNAVDATNALVNTIMATSKDLLATFGSISATGGQTSNPTLIHHHMQPQHQQQSSAQTVFLQTGAGQQQQHLKQTFLRAAPSLGGAAGLLQSVTQNMGSGISHQIVSIPAQQQQVSSQSLILGQQGQVQGSTLNTQSLQLPSGFLSESGSNSISTKITPSSSTSIPNLLDSDDLNLNLGSFTLGGLGSMNLDMGSVNLSDIDTSGISNVVGGGSGVDGVVDNIKLEMDCAMDKMDDLSGVLDGNPFDSIPNLSDELDGLDLDMVDGLCDFEGLLSEEKQYGSFFSLIRDVLCSTRDHRMTLVCLEKTIRKWQISPGAGLNPWYCRVNDWNGALIIALNFLAGNYQDVHPEDFVPYIEYKYKTKYYQWIGAGRDGDNNLTPLCTLWMDNLDRLPPLKKSEGGDGEEPEEEEDENEDSDGGTCGGDSSDAKKKSKRPLTPPPPRCTTDWTVRPSTYEEKEDFRFQEKSRFDNPHKAFTYRMHCYESVVGPVKGVYSSQTGVTNKARGHSLLVDDRPPYVTILALVRDAVARLPNGEGTRSEICEMLRDSAFLAPEASNVTLNSVVSGALDRLHYERDPCVRYDSHKKSWIYLHRDRTQDQFERLHHNRSYTKSTKSRNSSSRKSRKGSSKSSTSSSVSSLTAVIGINPPQTSSCSSSQSSISTCEASPVSTNTSGSAAAASAILSGTNNATNAAPTTATTIATILGVGSGAGGVVSTTSGGSLVTLPSMSGINPTVHTQSSNLQGSAAPTATTPSAVAVAGVSLQQQPSQTVKQTIGLMNVTTNPAGGTQGSSQHSVIATPVPISSGNQQQHQLTQLGRNVVAFSTGNPADGQQGSTPSLNEVLAAAAGLRFQPSTGTAGTPVVINQSILGGHGQQQQQSQLPGKQQVSLLSQDLASGQGTTTRLVLQQQSPHGHAIIQQTTQPGTGQSQTSAAGLAIQQATQGQIHSTGGGQAAATIGPGQILLGPSAAVLKLAGNLRLGEGLRLAQLRLPSSGSGAAAATVNAGSASSASLSSALRLPQHRILLARGGLPGQGQAQGVLLGQTANGQTVILSAGPPGSGSLAGLQALTGGGAGSSGQIALHTTNPTQSSLDSTTLPVTQNQHQSNFNQTLQAFTTSQGTTKFGIITNVPNSSGNSIMVSSGGCSLAPTTTAVPQQGTTLTTFSNVSANNANTRVLQKSLQTSTAATLPTTSIALPASLLPPVQHTSASGAIPTASSTISVSTGGTHSASQGQQSLPPPQQILLTTGTGGATTSLQQSQSSSSSGNNTGGAVTGVAAQLSAQHNLMLATSQQSFGSQQVQGSTGQTHQFGAPIIIRSAQGDFVSFGIPSNLSLGRGVQGIKVIPIQAGKQTVLARIVPPSQTTAGGANNTGTIGGGTTAAATLGLSAAGNAGVAVTGGGSTLNTTLSTSPNNTLANIIATATAATSSITASTFSNSVAVGTMQQQSQNVSSGSGASTIVANLQLPVQQQQQQQTNAVLPLTSCITPTTTTPLSNIASLGNSNNSVIVGGVGMGNGSSSNSSITATIVSSAPVSAAAAAINTTAVNNQQSSINNNAAITSAVVSIGNNNNSIPTFSTTPTTNCSSSPAT